MERLFRPKALVRAGDFVFRYGGEAFLVLVGGMTREILLMIAEKARLAVAQHGFRTSSGAPLVVTASLGLALHDGHPDDRCVISAADEALYEAKRAGRNRYVLLGSARGNTCSPLERGKTSTWQSTPDGST